MYRTRKILTDDAALQSGDVLRPLQDTWELQSVDTWNDYCQYA